MLAAVLCGAVLARRATAELPAPVPADFALVAVNPRLPYGFLAAAGHEPDKGGGVVLCYYDAAGRPGAAVYGAVAAPPSAKQCRLLNPDQAGLPKPKPGWKEAFHGAQDGVPFLGGRLLAITGGGRPLDNPYIYMDADGAQQGFYIVIRDLKPRHGQLCSDGSCIDVVSDIALAEPQLVVPVTRTLAFVPFVRDIAMHSTYNRQLLLLRRIPQELVSFDDHIFLVPSGLLPEFADKSASEQLTILDRFIRRPSTRAANIKP